MSITEVKQFNFEEFLKANPPGPLTDVPVPPELLELAKMRNFYHTPSGEYNEIFSQLFFKGGKLVKKKELHKYKPEYVSIIMRLILTLMQSFRPSHEEKEAVCALLLSEIIDSDKTKKENPEWLL